MSTKKKIAIKDPNKSRWWRRGIREGDKVWYWPAQGFERIKDLYVVKDNEDFKPLKGEVKQIVQDKIYFNLPGFAEMSVTEDLIDLEVRQSDTPIQKLYRFLVEPSLPQETATFKRNKILQSWKEEYRFLIFRDADKLETGTGHLFQFVCPYCYGRIYLEDSTVAEASLSMEGPDGEITNSKFSAEETQCVAKCRCRTMTLPKDWEAYYD